MDKKNEKINQKKKSMILPALAICLLLFGVYKCYGYALQNQELLAALAYRDETIYANGLKIAQLQAQLIAAEPSLHECKTETWDVPEAIFRTIPTAEIANPEEPNHMYESPNMEIDATVHYDWECMELENNLAAFPDCRVRMEMCDWKLNVQKTADALRERWERNYGQEGYYVSMGISPFYINEADDEAYMQNILTPFVTLAGDGYKEIIEEALGQEEGPLRFVRLERIGEITCCSFEIGIREGDGYHIVLDGKWEGKEIQKQHLYIPYTESEMGCVATYSSYQLERVDVNFDGKQDLLIHEGHSGGSGGSFDNYRAIVWNEEAGQFAYYPSFPEQLTTLEFYRQRVITNGQLGASGQILKVYGVVNGEYVCTRKLICQEVYGEEKQYATAKLLYYEMGELVQTHMISRLEEIELLYPDMGLDYWRFG